MAHKSEDYSKVPAYIITMRLFLDPENKCPYLLCLTGGLQLTKFIARFKTLSKKTATKVKVYQKSVSIKTPGRRYGTIAVHQIVHPITSKSNNSILTCQCRRSRQKIGEMARENYIFVHSLGVERHLYVKLSQHILNLHPSIDQPKCLALLRTAVFAPHKAGRARQPDQSP